MIKTFIKLGCTAFGGPAAHIAMLQEEFSVERHRTIKVLNNMTRYEVHDD